MKGLLFFVALLSNILPFNIVDVKVLIPGGESIGIEIKPHGVVVIGGYDVTNEKETYNPIKDSDIQKGDLIYQVACVDINNINELLCQIQKHLNENEVEVSLLRNNLSLTRSLRFLKTSSANTIKTGLLVKERILGVGTMTFYDPETKIYGALGHKLIDNDFINITDINSGTIFNSKVTGINKSNNGNVGELLASIYEDDVLGTLFANTDYGIFGYYDVSPDKKALEVASHNEIKLGKAFIYTTLDDDIVKQYQIEITSLQKQNTLSTKGITFKVTDPELLNKTGGIVQGMSGSPIIQDDKIIGAVTHVLVDQVKKGYGLYMDFMLEAATRAK